MISADPQPFKVLEGGKLKASGLAWWEPIASRYELRQRAIYWPMVPWIFTVPFMMYAVIDASNPRSTTRWDTLSVLLFLFTPICLAVQVAFYALTVKYRSVYDLVRVYFVVSGGEVQLTEEHGWFTDATDLSGRVVTTLKKPLWEINSIEVIASKNRAGGHYKFAQGLQIAETYFAYTVKFFFRDGGSYTIARDLRENDARMVQTQLDAAWREVWQVINMQQAAPAPSARTEESF